MLTLKNVVLAGAAILVGAACWGNRVPLTALVMSPAAPAPKAIVFDNGSVRALRTADPLVSNAIPEGALRRCTSKRETLYSDRECPAGFAQAPLYDTARVSVLASGTLAPAAAAPRAATEPNRRKSLYEVMDAQPDPQLRERMMERALGDYASR